MPNQFLSKKIIIPAIIFFGGLLIASGIFLFLNSKDSVKAFTSQTMKWAEETGSGISVPACGSSSVSSIICQSGAPSVPFTWENTFRIQNSTEGDYECNSVVIYNTANGQIIGDRLPCSGSYTWYPATNSATINYEIRHREYQSYSSSCGGWCFGTYSIGSGHLVASGTFITPSCGIFTLSVLKSGNGAGTVTSNPAGIDCGATCAADFNDGASVTLTASPAIDSSFTGWSGEGCSGTGTCTVTMTQARNVTATFLPLPDLIATNFSRTGTLVTGNTLTFSGDITNQGGSTAAASNARFCVDNPSCLTTTTGRLGTDQSVPSLGAGATSASFSREWTATAGDHTAYFCADVLNQVSELNESNNCGSISFNINSSPSAINLQTVQPNYCSVSFAAAILSWQFTDPDGSSQSAYQVQADNNSSFSSPEVDTGQVLSSSQSFATLPGALSFNTIYYWQLKVWDSSDLSSAWISGPSFTTPRHEYPTIDFGWTPQSPSTGEVARFTDQSIVYGGSSKSAWAWAFQQGNPAVSTQQNPTSAFISTGQKSITLSVTDSDGFSCQGQKTLVISLPLPDWREIPPF